MRFLTTLIIVLISLTILAGVTLLGYQFYQRLHAPAASPFRAIPTSASLVIKINKPVQFWSGIKRNQDIWKDILSMPYLNGLRQDIDRLDSLIDLNYDIFPVFRNNPLYIVLAQPILSRYGILFMVNVPAGLSEDKILTFVTNCCPGNSSIETSSYGGTSVYQLRNKINRPVLTLALRNRIFLASTEPFLVNQAIDRLSLNMVSIEDQNFVRLVGSIGKNVDANIFINYQRVAPFVSTLFTRGVLSGYLNVSTFADWSALDFLQKKDMLVINGLTAVNDTSRDYLALFTGQSPQKITMTSVLPGNTSSFTWIGLSDPLAYQKLLASSINKTSVYMTLYPDMLDMERENNVLLKEYFLPWVGNEIGLVNCFDSDKDPQRTGFACFRIADPAACDSLLKNLANLNQKHPQTRKYKDHLIGTIGLRNFIPFIWGNLFREMTGSNYTIINDFIIFGNDLSSLEQFIDKVSAGNILTNNNEYHLLSDVTSDKANLFSYQDVGKSLPVIQSGLTDHLAGQIREAAVNLSHFGSFGVQVTTREKDYYTNLFLHHISIEKGKSSAEWKTTLDSVVAGKPLIFSRIPGIKPFVLAYDLANLLYMLDEDGNIQWKLKLPGKPLGDIQVFKGKPSDSLRFILTTENHLCIVDKNGLFVYNSPFTLPAKVTAGVTMDENPPSGKLRLFVPLSDKRVHCYELNGKASPGWENPISENIINRQVQVKRIGSRTYVLIADASGKLSVTDLRGRSIIKPRNDVTFSPYSLIYRNQTNNKGLFLSTDRQGKLLFLKENGRISDVEFHTFTPNHIFFYEDFNLDKIREFIWFDLNKLYCYDRFRKLLFAYKFPAMVVTPWCQGLPDGEMVIATMSPHTQEVFLIGRKGALQLDPDIRGTTLFDIGSFDESHGTSLIIGYGREIREYLLPK